MTETRDTDTRSRTDEPTRADAPTMQDVDHTHPHTDRTFGGNFTFARGGVVAADGGRPDVVPEDGAEPPADEDDVEVPNDDEEVETLADVDHTPPNDSEDANRVFVRGGEDDQVEDE